MATYFLIYDPRTRLFVAAGNKFRLTYSMSAAKHLTSEWSAKKVLDKWRCELEGYEIRKIQTY